MNANEKMLQPTSYEAQVIGLRLDEGEKDHTVAIEHAILQGPEELTDPSGGLPTAFLDRLDEINETWRVIEDPVSGQPFEIAEVNTFNSSDEVDLEISTYSSSISSNPGNAAEFAFRGMLNPDTRRVYVATMGNGQSGHFTKKELAYFRGYGRMTEKYLPENIRALPTIVALHRALEAEKLRVTRISTDSFGGTIGTAFMAAAEKQQISNAYFKSRTNLSDRNPLALALDMVLVENEINGRLNRKNSTDPWGLHQNNFAMKRVAEERLTNIYGVDRPKPAGSKLLQLTSYAAGLSIGKTQNPAIFDTIAAQLRQPDAKITIDAPEADLLYKSREDIIHFVSLVGSGAVSRGLEPSVQVLLTDGTHGGHTWEPQKRAAAERYAFSRT